MTETDLKEKDVKFTHEDVVRRKERVTYISSIYSIYIKEWPALGKKIFIYI